QENALHRRTPPCRGGCSSVHDGSRGRIAGPGRASQAEGRPAKRRRENRRAVPAAPRSKGGGGRSGPATEVRVAALTEGVLQTMVLSKLKIAAVVLASGLLVQRGLADTPTAPAEVSGVLASVDTRKNTVTV